MTKEIREAIEAELASVLAELLLNDAAAAKVAKKVAERAAPKVEAAARQALHAMILPPANERTVAPAPERAAV